VRWTWYVVSLVGYLITLWVSKLYWVNDRISEYGAVDRMRTGKENRCTPRKPAPMPLCLPQIRYDLIWYWSWAALVRNRQLTTWYGWSETCSEPATKELSTENHLGDVSLISKVGYQNNFSEADLCVPDWLVQNRAQAWAVVHTLTNIRVLLNTNFFGQLQKCPVLMVQVDLAPWHTTFTPFAVHSLGSRALWH
jgi:hypothetical protein